MKQIKEIYCMPHSHFDLGYTHPQSMLLELQQDYIDDAIDLCIATTHYPEEAQFKWTCEATYPLMCWIKRASSERLNQFRKLVDEKRICITALPMHTTPGVNATQIITLFKDLEYLRTEFNADIDIAINHDINGQPWTFSNIMLDHGINFYLTGINIHFGGIPGPRPGAINWQAQDGRNLVSYLGEHYSLFSQFFYTEENSTQRLHQGICEQLKYLESINYNEDYVFLTATNPPLYDNNCPDMDLPKLVKQYNEENHDQKIRFVTPEVLRDKIFAKGTDNLPTMRGDWTDYWNFGSASTAREGKIARRSKELLRKAEVLSSVNGNVDDRYEHVVNRAYLEGMLYEEHTWGASQAMTNPEEIEVYSQEIQKKIMAYTFADMSTLAAFKQMEAFAKNPVQTMKYDGVMVINTSGTPQQFKLSIPIDFKREQKHISYQKIKHFLPFDQNDQEEEFYGTVTIPAFSSRTFTFKELEEMKSSFQLSGIEVFEDKVVTPFYEISFHKEKGRIIQIKELETNKNILPEDTIYALFEPVAERIDLRYHENVRETFFPRDIDLANHSISVWNHNWKGRRDVATDTTRFNVYIEGNEVVFEYDYTFPTTKSMNQKIVFSADHNRIVTFVKIDKEKIDTPDGLYFAVPLAVKEEWECIYDTAGTFVKLDEEQIGTTSKDWVTVEDTISIFDKKGGYTLACPDAPIVQTNGFRFGLESKTIERTKNPLLLAWPMNNYWNTNFVSSQEGMVSFQYELTPFTSFSENEAKRLGQTAKSPCIMFPVADAQTKEIMAFLDFEADNIFIERLTVDLEKNSDTLLLLKNYSQEKSHATIRLRDNVNIKNVVKENTAGRFISSVNVTNGEIRADLNAYELAYIRITTDLN